MQSKKNKNYKQFDRWQAREVSSWPFQVFKAYDFELTRNIWAFYPAFAYVYSELKKNGGQWQDSATKHFKFPKSRAGYFRNLRTWSDSFNEFENQTNLNILIAISSNFETYLASVVSLSLQSDPGVLFGAPRSIDGAKVLKHGSFSKLNFQAYIEKVTKGEWSSRAAALEFLFGKIPTTLTQHISDLEFIRKLRNNVAHAFGRDIEESRQHLWRKIVPSERLSRERVLKLKSILWRIAKHIDLQLLRENIGEFQAINIYHSIFPTLPANAHINNRAMLFKKRIGRSGVQTANKEFCKGLANYYESL